MRSSAVIPVLLGGILVATSAPQAAANDGQDLPCNALCRDWMGPAYHPADAERTDDTPAAVIPVRPEPQPPLLDRLVRRPPRTRPAKLQAAEPFREQAVERVGPGPVREVHRIRPGSRNPSRKEVAVRQTAPTRSKPAQTADLGNGSARAVEGTPGLSAKLNSPVTVTLAPDNRTIALASHGGSPTSLTLTAADADSLIEAVGAARSRMQPPPQQNWALGQSVNTVYDPRWTTEAERRKGDTLLHLRDPRFGWLHYTIPRMTAQQLGTLIQRQALGPVRRQAEVDSP